MIKKSVGIVIIVVILLVASLVIFKTVSKQLVDQNRPIIYVPKTLDNRFEFWKVMNQGVFTAAKEYGTEVKVMGTHTETDIEGQIKRLEEAISQKPKAIILAATDYSRLLPIAQNIIDAGITLITVDSGLDGGISSSFIATDNYAAGIKAAEALKPWITTDASIAIINFIKGSATAMERERGVRDQLKHYPEMNILPTFYSEGSEEKAYEIVAALVKNEPQIKGIIGLNEPSAIGAAKAIKDLKAWDRIKLIGFDSSMSQVSFLEEGILKATIVQKPFNMGYLAVKTALEVYDGKKVSSYVDTGSEVITKENMYTTENQKLFFPFVEK